MWVKVQNGNYINFDAVPQIMMGENLIRVNVGNSLVVYSGSDANSVYERMLPLLKTRNSEGLEKLLNE